MFEENLERSIFSNTKEKSFIDKLLAKEDVNAIRELVKKPELTRSDYLEILYLLSSAESKLLNYGEWDRYVILKFFVWIREFVKVAEILFDYKDYLDNKEKAGVMKLSSRAKKTFENNKKLIQHNIKFLVDLYLNIGRTSLSLGGTGILEVLRNKYEISYNDQRTPQGVGNQGGLLR